MNRILDEARTKYASLGTSNDIIFIQPVVKQEKKSQKLDLMVSHIYKDIEKARCFNLYQRDHEENTDFDPHYELLTAKLRNSSPDVMKNLASVHTYKNLCEPNPINPDYDYTPKNALDEAIKYALSIAPRFNVSDREKNIEKNKLEETSLFNTHIDIPLTR